MGLASHKGVQTRISSTTLANKSNASDKLLIGGKGNDLYRGQRVAGQGCGDRDTTHPGRLCITNLPGREERGGTEACNKSEGSQYVCEARALQNGRASCSPRPNPTRGLDDKIGSEGCLPSGTNSHRPSTPPPIPMGEHDIPISMSPIRTDICPTGFLQNNETCSGSTPTHGNSSSHLPRRHSNDASINGGTDTGDSIDMQTIRGPGSGGQSKEIHTIPSSDPGILGLSSGYGEPAVDFPSREAEENTAASPTPPSPTEGIGERSSEVRGEDLSCYTGHMASSSAFQSTAISNEFGVSREPFCGYRRCLQEVQYQSDLDQGGHERPQLVVCPRQEGPNAVPSAPQDTDYDNRVGCLQHRMGSPTRQAPDGWEVVPSGNISPHQLPRTSSCLSSATVLCQAQQWDYRSNEIGQCHSSDLHKQTGRNALPTIMSTSIDNLGLVYTEGCLSGGGTPTREGQYNSRSRIAINERSLRLDVKSSGLPEDTTGDGTTTDRSICVPTDKATTEILQLETRPRSSCDGCIQSGLGPDEGLCQSTMVPDRPLSEPSKETSGEGGDNHPSMGITTMVSDNSGNARGLSQNLASGGRPSHTSSRTGIHHEPRGTGVSGMARIRESFESRGISSEASALLLASWRPKTQSNYDSLFSKWSCWCSQRNRNPIEGPVEDVANFLADLFKEGYLYRSLNSYRSAISALHSKVDGYSIGQHPLITRMLKGVFNERPPVARYSAFWDVGVVLRYLKGLGTNDTLTLRMLTIKSVMLMALTRPARSVDLSKLDIGARSFSQAGVTFKALHLSKQSRVSKPLADFFYPRYTEDQTICPVVTLQAYEARTLEFRAWSTENRKSLLFLSWIGKHDPVTGSTIARWLKTCLTQAGINTEIFKAHSVRGASSSTAATAGVTTADILKAADWSSAGTFQKFYLRPTKDDRSSFGTAVLSSAQASNLHVDIETEPSEM